MDAFLERRRELVASAEPGTATAEALASVTDEAVCALAQAASARAKGRWALVALGGYGAGRLLPASDLDLLVLSEDPERTLKPFVEALLYPLWDAGLAVGHQVRSRKQQLVAVRAEIDTLTATLNGRFLAGDADYAATVLDACAADARKRSKRTLAALAARERPGSPYLLEPDLKDGAGGQRDIDEAGWTASVIAGRPRAGLGALVEAGLLTADERDRLLLAQEKVTAARWDLQRAAERSRSGSRASALMTLDAAADVRLGAEIVQRALADTHHVLLRLRERVAGRATVPSADAATTEMPLRARALFALLDRGAGALDELEDAAWGGRLEQLAPGMRALMTARRPGLGHTYTVGAHCLRAATLVADIGAQGPELARSLAAIRGRRVLLYAATLAHDLGKAEGGPGHAERGAPLAAGVARRMGLADDDAVRVETLVREHLLLAETASAEDVDDEDVVLAAAARLGDRGLVPALHVLTAADSLATGPSLWTPWHAALVGRLVARLDAALAPEVDGAGIASRAETVRAEALGALVDRAPDEAAAFVRDAPMRYLAACERDEVVAHAGLVAAFSRSAGTQFATAVRPGLAAGSFRVAVAAADRRELFARIAGALTLAGLDILGADAYSASSGVDLDLFEVRSATDAVIEEGTWARFERYLGAALSDRLELQTRLAERSRTYAARTLRRVQPRVELDTSRGYATVVTVKAPDRVGLLHDLARAISEAGLDIRFAKVSTRDGVALDTFHLVDGSGQAPDDPGVLGHVSMRLREAC